MDRLLAVKHIISLWKQAPGDIHHATLQPVCGSLHQTLACGAPTTVTRGGTRFPFMLYSQVKVRVQQKTKNL